ncbi:MAG: 3-dehydroquinate synthase [Syntrophomonadaceae bacterium]|nr:3-dehydroquinate synthase [Syntrophomonadaceae bacterium]
MKTLRVELGVRAYTITIGEGFLDQTGKIACDVARSRRVLLVSNPTVFALYGTRTTASLEKAGLEVITQLVPDGEEYKTLAQVETVIDRAVEKQLDRQTLVVALGGGVIGDLAGFVAAIYQRGVDFLQIPTTLLAQVDSSVGGKVAVNHRQAKNMMGAFHQPRAVLIDTSALFTLDGREYAAGMAEVVKYGVALDRDFFTYLENRLGEIGRRELPVLEEIIYRSCSLKARVVERDETEQGLRAVLNLGHTFGHALEALTQYRTYRHGEAVAAGMVVACYLSEHLGLMKDTEVARVKALLQKLGLPVALPGFASETIMEAMYLDKKVQGGKLRLVLPRGIGANTILDDVRPESIRTALERARI